MSQRSAERQRPGVLDLNGLEGIGVESQVLKDRGRFHTSLSDWSGASLPARVPVTRSGYPPKVMGEG